MYGVLCEISKFTFQFTCNFFCTFHTPFITNYIDKSSVNLLRTSTCSEVMRNAEKHNKTHITAFRFTQNPLSIT